MPAIVQHLLCSFMSILGSSGHSAASLPLLQGVGPQQVTTGLAGCFITLNLFGHAGAWLRLLCYACLCILFTSVDGASSVTSTRGFFGCLVMFADHIQKPWCLQWVKQSKLVDGIPESTYPSGDCFSFYLLMNTGVTDINLPLPPIPLKSSLIYC